MSRIWAVARHMIAESIRMKIALVFILIIVVVLPTLPFVVAGDGLTLKSRIQSFLSYSLGMVTFLLSLLTVFLACSALSNEIRLKHVFMIVSKPISRWQFFAGKWLGIVLLDAALLALTGLAVFASVWYLSRQPTTVPGDREAIDFEVLNVRHGMRAEPPDFQAQIDEEIRRLREEGRLDDTSMQGEHELRTELWENLKKSWRSVGPGETKQFVFRDLLVDREQDGLLHLRMEPTHYAGLENLTFEGRMQFGDRNDPNTLTPVLQWDFLVKRFSTIPIPNRAVNADGTLYAYFENLDPEYTITFEGPDSFELLYGLGTFHWNLFRGLMILWCRLAFLAAAGLLASSFLSFPVACMACFLVFFVAISASFLADSLAWVDVPEGVSKADPLWIVGPVLRPIAQMFVWLVPDFSKYDPVGNVVSGRLIPLKWVIVSMTALVLFKGLILGALGCIVLTRRELGLPSS